MNTSFQNIPEDKKVYFASDFHLGSPDDDTSSLRESKIVRWLDHVKVDAGALFLVGDIFDFWFEYKDVIPKGFLRFQGKLAELSDAGIPIIFFSGNHDLWMKDYFKSEIGVEIFHQPTSFQIGNESFYVAHGDGLGGKDKKYRFIKKIFTNPLSKWLFYWLHPNMGITLAKFWSSSSRKSNEIKQDIFLGDDEPLYRFAQFIEQSDHHAYYIFGHRHMTIEQKINDNSRYINLGDWFSDCSYLVYDGNSAVIQKIED